jgi:hypothetical protein
VLPGRRGESEALDRLLEDVRAGESRALVLRGEPGIGKTALLDYAIERASGFRVARAAGVQSEMELAFAGVHQLCAPMLDRLERLPDPQRDALRTAFALSTGNVPDRFFVGLAVLSLLSEVADEQPLLCVGHWQTPPIQMSIPIAAPGTARKRRQARTKASRRNSSARRAARRRAAVWGQQPRSSNGRRS